MIEYKSDEEKAEDVKAWWREYGSSVVAAVVLAIVGLFGWEYWQKHQLSKAETAAATYQSLSKATDKAQSAKLLSELQNSYGATPYASLGALDSAKNAAEQGDLDTAAKDLRWVMDNAKDADLKTLATLRLARVLVSQNKPDEALKLMDGVTVKAYESLKEELKGDVFAAKNQVKEAREAYQKAMAANQAGKNDLIQLKLDNLGQGA